MSPAKTAAQRKANQRARAKDAGLAEVRGILAPPLRHPEVKEAAAKVLRRKPKLSSSVRSSLKCEEHDEPHIDGWPLYSCLPPPKEPT